MCTHSIDQALHVRKPLSCDRGRRSSPRCSSTVVHWRAEHGHAVMRMLPWQSGHKAGAETSLQHVTPVTLHHDTSGAKAAAVHHNSALSVAFVAFDPGPRIYLSTLACEVRVPQGGALLRCPSAVEDGAALLGKQRDVHTNSDRIPRPHQHDV